MDVFSTPNQIVCCSCCSPIQFDNAMLTPTGENIGSCVNEKCDKYHVHFKVKVPRVTVELLPVKG